MVLRHPGPAEAMPLEAVDRALPDPGPGEVRVRVEVCAVCRTDLHIVEGDLEPHRPEIVPGHEVVGRIDACGAGSKLPLGQRVGIPWLHRSCGRCRFCARGDENLCESPRFTGWDADGGYAEFALAPADFVYPLSDTLLAREVAPLLCAGIIGFRAYRRCGIRPGGRLGLYGFGGSAHIVIQIALHDGCEVFVFSRGGAHRELARELGAAWVGAVDERPPRPLDAAILFAPAGEIVLPALEALDRGGVLAIAGIHLSEVPSLDYERHLFQEREIRSVTANTRADGRALLKLAEEIPIRTHTSIYALEAAGQALVDLKQDRIRGAAVLAIGSEAE